MLVGYARVSTHDQDTATQVDALRVAGVHRVFEEQASGVHKRPTLEALLYSVRRGDVVVVYKVDRFARSLADLLRILARIEALGASFRSLTEPIDTGTPVGRLMVQLLGSFAEFERSVIWERCSAGRQLAASRGVRFGRPRKIPVELLPMHRAQGLNARQIAEIYGVDTSSVTTWLCRLGLNPRGTSTAKKLSRYLP
ncbi:MAG: recombinase family protein [Proteobacteria bacterium]|nr:recombinase family protein [Pseudomonadota bacterium]